MTIEAMNIVATGLPKTIEDYQLALNAAFSGGRAFGEAVMQGRAIKLAVAEANDKRLEALAQPEQEPVAYIPTDALEQIKHPTLLLHGVTLHGYKAEGTTAVYTTPPQRKPQFKEFIKWAGAQGYDCAQTCNSDTGEWICLNPMTADLWKAWQAAHGIKD